MIRIVLGLQGSGKTASIVREMYIKSIKNNNKIYYSNIITNKIKNNHSITAKMIVKKEVVKVKKNGEEEIKRSLNEEFWKNLQQKYKNENVSLTVILDEAHNIMNPRRSMSKVNIIMGDFMSLLRRVLGQCEGGYGELILITQLRRRLDVIALELATKIDWCRCYYYVTCNKCKSKFEENNEKPNKIERCPKCNNHQLKRTDFEIEVTCFNSIKNLELWQSFNLKTYYDRYIIKDISEYFKFYDTLQWDDLVTEIYE